MGTGANWVWYANQCNSGFSIASGSSSINVSPNSNTTYYLRAEGGYCSSVTPCLSVTINVNNSPTPSIITAVGNSIICPGDSLILNGNTGGVWSTGATTTSITVYTTGDYYVINSNSCGTAISNYISATSSSPPPAISISGPNYACFGDNATLTALPYCSTCTYSWSNNTFPPITTGNIYTDSYTSTTSLYVTASNACGFVTSPVYTITVPSGAVAPIITGNTSICSGGSTNLSVSKPCAGCNYSWNPTGQSGTSVNLNPPLTTTYTCTATNACYWLTASSQVTVSVGNFNPDVIITANGPTSFCDGDGVILTANPAGTNYIWSPSGDTTQSIFVSAAGTYNVTITNAGNCSGTFNSQNNITTTVFSNPVANAGNDQNITPGNSVTIGGLGTGGLPPFQYYWSPSTGLSSTTVYNPTVSNISTTLNYVLTIVDANGCADADTVIVYFSSCNYNLSPTQSPLFTASASNGSFNVSEIGSSCTSWNINNNCNFINITSPSLPYSGNATVSYTIDTNTSSQARTCTLLFPDGSTYTINQQGALANCVLPNVVNTTYYESLNQLVADNYLNCTYQWYLNGAILNDDTTRFVTTNVSGIYYVVVSCNGNSIQSPDIPIFTSINENMENKISIYPNPTRGNITINGVFKMNMKITNTLGQTIFSKMNSNNNEVVDLNDFAKGVYFIELSDERNLIVKKIIKN